jgi:glycosyltransferase involved in cell wall biosynthesis
MGLSRGLRDTPRVAVVYPIPFGEDGLFGGGERYAHELARALARHTPTRLVTFGDRGPRRRMEGELEVRTHKPLAYPHGERLNPFSLGFLRDLRGMDVIHCTSWNTLVTDMAVAFAHWTGKRSFITDVGGGARRTLQRFLPVRQWVDGYLLIAAQGGAQFTEYRDRWSIIYAGIDTEYHRPAGRERRGVLYVGRLLPHKGIDTLIEAAEPDMPLRIMGRPYHAEYFALLQRLAAGKDVTFVTDAGDEEVLAAYQSAAVSVLPSVNRTVYGDYSDLPELLGFTLLEAMSCGAAVICSRVGALEEVVVDGESGYIVPPGDPAALRDRLRRLLGDPEHAARLGQAARRRIEERFTWEAVARRCLAAYQK